MTQAEIDKYVAGVVNARQAVLRASKAKTRALAKIWRDANREHRRLYRKRHGLRANYSMTLEERDAILASQGGVCAVNGCTKPGGRGDWIVDHCHVTGRVRGILCTNCNLALGHTKDSPSRLRNLADYLEKQKEKALADEQLPRGG